MKMLKNKSKRLIGLLTILIILASAVIVINIDKFKAISKVDNNQSNITDEKNMVGKHLQQGKITTVIGTGKEEKKDQLNKPRSIYIDKLDNTYIVDSGNHIIRMIPKDDGTYFGIDMKKGNTYTVAGNGIVGEDDKNNYSGDNGKATSAQLYFPKEVTLDSKGNLYIVDTGNGCIRKVDKDGVITTIDGIGQRFSTETESIQKTIIHSIAVDNSDTLYIGESRGSFDTYIRKVDVNTGEITNITSKNVDKSIVIGGDDRPLKDIFMNPDVKKIIFDSDNNMYISTGSVISMIPVKDGVNFNIPMKANNLYFVAGRYDSDSYQGDGITGIGIKLQQAHGMTIDSYGNLCVYENKSGANDNNTIHFIDKKSGLASKIIGDGNKKVSNNPKEIKIGSTGDIALDSDSNLYIGDYENSRVYKIEPKKQAKTPPTLKQEFDKNTINKSVELSFKDDKNWRSSISKIYVNGQDIKRKYKLSEGKLVIDKKVFNTSGIYVVKIKAKGYEDNLTVKKINEKAKILKPATNNNRAGHETIITFEDDEDWKNGVLKYSGIYGVFVNGKRIHLYEFSEGKLHIDPVVVSKPGIYEIKIKSLGYDDSIVTQEIIEREDPTEIDISLSEFKTFAGTGERGDSGEGGLPTDAKLRPHKIYIDKSDNIFILDSNNQKIKMIPKENGTYYGVNMTKGMIYTVAGDGAGTEQFIKNFRVKGHIIGDTYIRTGKSGGDGGPAINAHLNNPRQVATDKYGNLYIADNGNNSIRKVDTNGTITTIVGTAGRLPLKKDGQGIVGDGEQAKTALISNAAYIYIDDEEEVLYFVQTLAIRKVDLKTGIINTISGFKSEGGVDLNRKDAVGDGEAIGDAEFTAIGAITFDKDKNLYILDNGHIRMSPNESGTYFGTNMEGGNIYTIAGDYIKKDNFGDGYSIKDARFTRPDDIAIDSRGNLYIADPENNNLRYISKSTNTVHTIASKEKGGFERIVGVAIDKDDNIYIGDSSRYKIYKAKITYK